MTMEPPPLDYASQRQLPRRDGSWPLFFFGLVSGLVFSGLYYWGMAALGMFDQFPAAGFGAIVIKIVAAILLFRVPRWRSFGIGLLVSMPLAVLIFVCACFGVFAFHL